jgi:hypothetical protein
LVTLQTERHPRPPKETHVPQYALLLYHPPEGPPQDNWAEQRQAWQKFTDDLTEAGALVYNQGLAGADAATTVRVRDGESQITDGPFAETKEILAGVVMVEAADLDTALDYAGRVPSAEYGSVEVRPVWG